MKNGATFLIFLITGFSVGAFLSSVFAEEADPLRWRFEGQRRMRDGGVEAHFSLYGADALKIDELEFFYTTAPFSGRRYSDVKSEDRAEVYHKEVSPDTRNIVIYSGRYARVQLWAVAEVGSVKHVTQTELNLYGESGLSETGFEELEELPPLPGLDIRRNGRYSAMTGEPVSFNMKNGQLVPLQVFLDGEMITELRPEADVYDYVFPGGRKLATRSLMDHHELLFVADVFDMDDAGRDIRFSCYLPLYRSMHDNQDMPGGLVTLFSAAVLGAIVVVLKGRHFAWR